MRRTFLLTQRWVGTEVSDRKSRKSELAQKSEIGNQNFFRKSEGKKCRKSEFRPTSVLIQKLFPKI